MLCSIHQMLTRAMSGVENRIHVVVGGAGEWHLRLCKATKPMTHAIINVPPNASTVYLGNTSHEAT